jgi:hypothetical protein
MEQRFRMSTLQGRKTSSAHIPLGTLSDLTSTHILSDFTKQNRKLKVAK